MTTGMGPVTDWLLPLSAIKNLAQALASPVSRKIKQQEAIKNSMCGTDGTFFISPY